MYDPKFYTVKNENETIGNFLGGFLCFVFFLSEV